MHRPWREMLVVLHVGTSQSIHALSMKPCTVDLKIISIDRLSKQLKMPLKGEGGFLFSPVLL